MCLTWWYGNEAQASNSSNPPGESQPRATNLFACICNSDQIGAFWSGSVIHVNVGWMPHVVSRSRAVVGAAMPLLGPVKALLWRERSPV